jgi:tetratricopeptide (TPR) repeat protein
MGRYWREIGIAVVLCGVVFAAFGPALDNTFLLFDDYQYIGANSHVLGGLSGANCAWAFRAFYSSNWHPLTWLSLQADVTIFGPGPRGVHLMNLVFHAAAAVSLFLALRLMTGLIGRSAFVAAFFAVHPLRVESVAWAAERKDVLSGLFCMLTLLAYGWYARRPTLRRYLLVVAAFTLGLLAKPMLVTLPFVLLLLDWWPLRRLAPLTAKPSRGKRVEGKKQTPHAQPVSPRGREEDGPATAQPAGSMRFGALLWEKAPLFALAGASCLVTILAQQVAAMPLATSGISNRLQVALVSYVAYLGNIFWPVDLAALYPYPVAGLPAWQVGGAVAVLLGLTWLAWRLRASEPGVLMGWLWYLGTLVPVIGLIQVGSQMKADRYTYLPSVGLGIALVWPAADLAARLHRERVLAGVAAVLLGVALVLTWGQVHFWHDDLLLWERTLEVTGPANVFVQEAIGVVLTKADRLEEAAEHLAVGVQLAPRDLVLQGDYGSVLLRMGYRQEALEHLTLAATAQHPSASILLDLGVALYQLGRFDEAMERLQAAIDADPTLDSAYSWIGQCLCRQEKWDEAMSRFSQAVQMHPEKSLYRCQLAYTLSRRGDTEAAAAAYREASRIDADWVAGYQKQAWRAATAADARFRNPVGALDLAERLCDATGSKVPEYLETLAAAYAAVGRYQDAVVAARKALAAVEPSPTQRELADVLRQHLAIYERHEPLRIATTGKPAKARDQRSGMP